MGHDMDGRAPTGSGFQFVQEVWARRKWLAILVFAGALTLAVSVALFLPNIYRATATVLVEREQIPQTFVRPAVTVELETRLQTISEQVLSRSRLQEVINLFSLYPDQKSQYPMDEVVQRMRKDLQLELKTVEQPGGRGATIAFALSYRGMDPETVAQVANTLASFYIEENWKTRGRQATETADFFKIQLEEMRKRVEEQERRVRDAKRRSPGERPDLMHANLLNLERLSTQLRLSVERLTRLTDRRETLARQLAEAGVIPMAAVPHPKIAQLAKLKQELAELRRSYTDKYPDVIRLKADIAALERETAEPAPEAAAAPSPAAAEAERLKKALHEVDAEIQGLRDEEKRLKQAILSQERRLETMPAPDQDLDKLTREYDAVKELYSSLLKRSTDARQAEELEQQQKGEKFRILDPAVAPKEPTAPARFRLILMGLMFSLGLAAGSVVLAEQLDTSFHSVDSLRTFTRIPVLVSIAQILTDADILKQRRRARLIAAASVAGLLLIVGISLLIAHGNDQLVWMLSRGKS